MFHLSCFVLLFTLLCCFIFDFFCLHIGVPPASHMFTDTNKYTYVHICTSHNHTQIYTHVMYIGDIVCWKKNQYIIIDITEDNKFCYIYADNTGSIMVCKKYLSVVEETSFPTERYLPTNWKKTLTQTISTTFCCNYTIDQILKTCHHDYKHTLNNLFQQSYIIHRLSTYYDRYDVVNMDQLNKHIKQFQRKIVCYFLDSEKNTLWVDNGIYDDTFINERH